MSGDKAVLPPPDPWLRPSASQGELAEGIAEAQCLNEQERRDDGQDYGRPPTCPLRAMAGAMYHPGRAAPANWAKWIWSGTASLPSGASGSAAMAERRVNSASEQIGASSDSPDTSSGANSLQGRRWASRYRPWASPPVGSATATVGCLTCGQTAPRRLDDPSVTVSTLRQPGLPFVRPARLLGRARRKLHRTVCDCPKVGPADRHLVARVERLEQVGQRSGRGDGLAVQRGDGVTLGQPALLRG